MQRIFRRFRDRVRICAAFGAFMPGWMNALGASHNRLQGENDMMRLALGFMLAFASVMPANTAPAPRQGPSGAAVDIPNSEIDTALEKTASQAVSDQQLRVASINGQYDVGVAVVHRARTAGRDIGGAAEHSQITEIYHIISGNGTLVTGGALAGTTTRKGPNALTGPSTDGSRIR